MNRSQILEVALFIAIVILISNSVAVSRDYQDSWILEGLEIPFLLFVTMYTVTFFSEKRVSRMIALAVIGRLVFLLIPNLKYVWFQGIWIDQHQQYALANHVCSEGYIATQGLFGVSVYGGTPLIHLTFAIFSIILNIPVVHSIKYLPVLLSPIYPMLTYLIMKKLKFLQGTTALKYALFLSSMPTIASYVVTGTVLGSIFVFFILFSLIALDDDRRYSFVFIFFTSALAAWHTSSSILLSVFLLILLLLQKVHFLRLRSYLKPTTVLFAVSISAAWLMFQASFTLERIVEVFRSGLLGNPTPGGEQIPIRFFDLVRIDMLEAVKSVFPYYGGDIFMLLFTFVSLLVMLKIQKKLSDTSNFLFVFESVVLLSMPIGLLLKAGAFRTLHFARSLFPIFSSIPIVYLIKRKVWLRPIILLPIILLAPLQFYRCEPLIPSANVLFGDLAASEPIVYTNLVNSAYQRQMINFAKGHVTGRIVSDRISRNQIIGLTDFDFALKHIDWSYYYPLDKGKLKRVYDCFLIHLPGISGGFGEKAEMRTRHVILEAIYNSSVVYTNGESYILTYSFTQP